MREINKDKLNVKIYSGRPELGAAAAEILTAKISELLKTKEYINIIFASAPSQNEFLAELLNKNIEWNRINAFHMDEYVGLHPDAPQGFGNFLKDRLFSKVNCREVHYLNGNAVNIQDECKRYSDLLIKYPTDIVCLGIGENTHLAFNDPHVADFNDPEIVKVVDLDQDCRTQQVNDGCFASIDDVPTHALTITMPALFKSTFAYAIVPGKFKANAIYHTLNSDISELYPSTILRKHDHAILFIDEDSASDL
ncbi:glucosamine-6-phosphate deaminase [Daejeonella rubra]|uniref:Glucosamine-6-phosphate deaminase n=1 Tax=Daejeonella rubra TaxID=990371 RepID=A0A1G9SKW9_9SPHI|nr:glucosamine-6-phosphate deaminase [Daejeonella rubra]SDM36136.1 glucosamine-6-phosphate deaminase [Daejeonella rubra]